MSLKKLLLDKQLPDPFNLNYKQKRWDAALSINDTAEDKDFYETAVIFRTAAEAVIKALDKTTYFQTDKRNLVEWLLIYANSNTAKLLAHFTNENKLDRKAGKQNFVGRKPRVSGYFAGL